jgi:hypothetical protein
VLDDRREGVELPEVHPRSLCREGMICKKHCALDD